MPGDQRSIPGRLESTVLMAALYFRTVLGRRKSIATLAIVAVVLVVALVAAITVVDSGRLPLYRQLLSQLPLGILIQLAALLYGTAVVREELESRTLTYLWVRPIRRWTIVLGRWLAATVTTVGLALAVCVILHLLLAPPSIPSELRLGHLALVASLGAVYYTTIFTAMSVLFRRPLAIGLGYILFWEMSLPLVPSMAAALSIRYHLLNLTGLMQQGDRPAFLEPPVLDPSASLTVLICASCLFFVLSLWFFPRREYLARHEAS